MARRFPHLIYHFVLTYSKLGDRKHLLWSEDPSRLRKDERLQSFRVERVQIRQLRCPLLIDRIYTETLSHLFVYEIKI